MLNLIKTDFAGVTAFCGQGLAFEDVVVEVGAGARHGLDDFFAAVEIFGHVVLDPSELDGHSWDYDREGSTQLVADLEVVLLHVLANDVVRVLLFLVYAVYRLVGFLLLVAGLFGLVLVGRRAEDGHFDTEWLQGLQLAVRNKLKILQFMRRLGFGINHLDFGIWMRDALLFFFR